MLPKLQLIFLVSSVIEKCAHKWLQLPIYSVHSERRISCPVTFNNKQLSDYDNIKYLDWTVYFSGKHKLNQKWKEFLVTWLFNVTLRKKGNHQAKLYI